MTQPTDWKARAKEAEEASKAHETEINRLKRELKKLEAKRQDEQAPSEKIAEARRLLEALRDDPLGSYNPQETATTILKLLERESEPSD